MKKLQLAIAFVSVMSVFYPMLSHAQCADCDANFNKRERQKLEDWKEADRIREKQIELDNGNRHVKGEQAAKDIVEELIQKGVTPKGE